VIGTNGFDSSDGTLSPSLFVAVTAHVYVLPYDRPVTVIGLVGELAVFAAPPSPDVQVAVKPVMGSPPSLAGGVNVTWSDGPGVAATCTPVGGSGGTGPTAATAMPVIASTPATRATPAAIAAHFAQRGPPRFPVELATDSPWLVEALCPVRGRT
jgi:hypothetical protein